MDMKKIYALYADGCRYKVTPKTFWRIWRECIAVSRIDPKASRVKSVLGGLTNQLFLPSLSECRDSFRKHIGNSEFRFEDFSAIVDTRDETMSDMTDQEKADDPWHTTYDSTEYQGHLLSTRK